MTEINGDTLKLSALLLQLERGGISPLGLVYWDIGNDTVCVLVYDEQLRLSKIPLQIRNVTPISVSLSKLDKEDKRRDVQRVSIANQIHHVLWQMAAARFPYLELLTDKLLTVEEAEVALTLGEQAAAA